MVKFEELLQTPFYVDPKLDPAVEMDLSILDLLIHKRGYLACCKSVRRTQLPTSTTIALFREPLILVKSHLKCALEIIEFHTQLLVLVVHPEDLLVDDFVLLGQFVHLL